MISATKARLSGKRKVIDRESLISTIEKLNDVRNAEWALKKEEQKRRRYPRGAIPKPGESQATNLKWNRTKVMKT